MTAPLAFRRESADVQAMRLDSPERLLVGKEWMEAHGVISSIIGSWPLHLTIYGPGSRMVAQLGDWLTYDGEQFAVEADDGGKPSGHTKVEGEG